MEKIRVLIFTEDERGNWSEETVEGVLVGKHHALIVDGYHLFLELVEKTGKEGQYKLAGAPHDSVGHKMEKEINDPYLLDKIHDMSALEFLNVITSEAV